MRSTWLLMWSLRRGFLRGLLIILAVALLFFAQSYSLDNILFNISETDETSGTPSDWEDVRKNGFRISLIMALGAVLGMRGSGVHRRLQSSLGTLPVTSRQSAWIPPAVGALYFGVGLFLAALYALMDMPQSIDPIKYWTTLSGGVLATLPLVVFALSTEIWYLAAARSGIFTMYYLAYFALQSEYFGWRDSVGDTYTWCWPALALLSAFYLMEAPRYISDRMRASFLVVKSPAGSETRTIEQGAPTRFRLASEAGEFLLVLLIHVAPWLLFYSIYNDLILGSDDRIALERERLLLMLACLYGAAVIIGQCECVLFRAVQAGTLDPTSPRGRAVMRIAHILNPARRILSLDRFGLSIAVHCKACGSYEPSWRHRCTEKTADEPRQVPPGRFPIKSVDATAFFPHLSLWLFLIYIFAASSMAADLTSRKQGSNIQGDSQAAAEVGSIDAHFSQHYVALSLENIRGGLQRRAAIERIRQVVAQAPAPEQWLTGMTNLAGDAAQVPAKFRAEAAQSGRKHVVIQSMGLHWEPTGHLAHGLARHVQRELDGEFDLVRDDKHYYRRDGDPFFSRRSFLDNAVHWLETEESANHSPPPLAGDTPIYVDVNTTATRPNGKTWSKAFPTIQEGIEAAYRRRVAGVWVADGVYAEERREEDGALVMRPGVHLYGGFAGDEDLRGQRDWETHATVIDGAQSRDGSAAYHVVVGANQSTLDGFTITGGNANGPIFGADGGGMFNNEVSPEVRNCLFQGNTAEDNGGGIYWREANALIARCRFEGNQAKSGGAFDASKSDLVITDCHFEANISTGLGAGLSLSEVTAVISDCMFEANQSGSGAAIFSSDSDLEIRDSQFLQNDGGAVYILSGGLHLITRCRFEGNRAERSAAVACNEASLELTHCDFIENFAERLGGAVRVSDMTAATIAYCTFRGNEAKSAGGAVYISSSNTTVSHCEFDGNTAQSSGGALALWGGGDPHIEHSIFRGNEAENGGAVHLFTSTPLISNSLFVNNTARDRGGVLIATQDGTVSLVHCTLVDNHAGRFDVAATPHGAGAVTFTNSILWDNGASPLDQGVEVRYSNVQGGAPGSTNLDADPRFVDPSVGDYRLLPDSPSIDAGVAEGEASDDLDGQARPQGRTVDLGAYEFVFK